MRIDLSIVRDLIADARLEALNATDPDPVAALVAAQLAIDHLTDAVEALVDAVADAS